MSSTILTLITAGCFLLPFLVAAFLLGALWCDFRAIQEHRPVAGGRRPTPSDSREGMTP